MAADLHIHIMTDDVDEDDLRKFFSRTIGHKWGKSLPSEESISWEENLELMTKLNSTPNVWVGEVSWLKAALFEDDDTYIPDPIGKLSELIDDGVTTIDEKFITMVEKAFGHPNQTDYSIANVTEVVEFLREHIGKRIFAVSW